MRLRAGLTVIVLAALAGCDREARPLSSASEDAPRKVAVGRLTPGGETPNPADPRGPAYEGVAYHIAQGQLYYRWFNCNGCHANGGGSIGPPLMDDKWIYGGTMDQIYDTIAHGRPNGMPAFQDKIPEQQIWQIAAYVRSLSGNADKLAAPSRPDAARSIPPINNIDKQPPDGGQPGGGGH